MSRISDFVQRLLRGLVRLALVAAALVLALSLLLAALVVLVAVTAWSVIAGRKAEPAKVFGRFRQASARYTAGVWPHRAGAAAPSDIVDVQAHEVRDIPGQDATGAARAQPPGADSEPRLPR